MIGACRMYEWRGPLPQVALDDPAMASPPVQVSDWLSGQFDYRVGGLAEAMQFLQAFGVDRDPDVHWDLVHKNVAAGVAVTFSRQTGPGEYALVAVLSSANN